jgi:hypothetical protein
VSVTSARRPPAFMHPSTTISANKHVPLGGQRVHTDCVVRGMRDDTLARSRSSAAITPVHSAELGIPSWNIPQPQPKLKRLHDRSLRVALPQARCRPTQWTVFFISHHARGAKVESDYSCLNVTLCHRGRYDYTLRHLLNPVRTHTRRDFSLRRRTGFLNHSELLI